MSGKNFKCRYDSSNTTAIKENVVRTITVRGVRKSVSFGLNSELELSPISVIVDNTFRVVSEGELDVLEKKRGVKPIYYSLSNISYMATVSLQYNKKNKVIERSIVLYRPEGIYSLDSLFCNRVTSELSEDARIALIEKFTPFVLRRVKE